MPIKDLNSIDVIGEPKDKSGVILCITTSGHLDSSARTQKLLLDKIENYLGYINSEEFKGKFGALNAEEIVIRLKCLDKPDPMIMKLCSKIVPWVEENGARIEMEIK
jgi:hypothetical protein